MMKEIWAIFLLLSTLFITNLYAEEKPSTEFTRIDSIIQLADSLQEQYQLKEAYRLLLSIKDKVEESGDNDRIWGMYSDLGRIHFYWSEYDSALSYWSKSLDIALIMGDIKKRCLNLTYIGITFKNLGEYEKALTYTLKALDIAREIENKNLLSLTLGNIGIIYKNMGQYNVALPYYQEALSIARESDDRKEESRHLGNIANVYRHLGDYKQALIHYQTALMINEELGDKSGISNDIGNLGIVFNRLGEYDKALYCYQEGLRLSRELGDKKGEAIRLGNIGIFYQNLGDLERAAIYYEKGHNISSDIGDKDSEAWFLTNLAGIYNRMKDYQKALDFYGQALGIYVQIGNISDEAITLGNIGIVYMDKGDYHKALQYYEQSLQINSELGSKKSVGINLHNIGYVHVILGDYDKAMDNFKSGLQIHVSIGEKEWSRKCFEQIGKVYINMGMLDSAYFAYSEAIKSGESLRDKLTSSNLKAGYFRRSVTVYKSMIDLDYMLYVENGDPRYIEEAYHYAEAYRSRAFLDQLTEAKAGLREGLSEEILQDERELMSRIGWISNEIASIKADENEHDTNKLKGYEDQLLEKEEELERLHSRIMTESPRYADLQYPEPVTLKEVQDKIVDDKTVLLEYTLIDSASYLWCIKKHSYHIYRTKGKDEIKEEIYNLRQEVALPRAYNSKFVKQSRRLYNWLVSPCENALTGIENLIIIQDDVLGYLPFELLLYREVDPKNLTNNDNYAKLPYLINRFKIHYSPSATVLTQIREHPKETLSDSGFVMMDFLGFANPQYTPLDTDSVWLEKDTGGSNRDYLIAENFEPLPNTEVEVLKIASIFPPANYNILTGPQASEAFAKSREFTTNYHYIHYACHGMFDEDNPQLSGLVLSLFPSDSTENGKLQMYEIFNLDLHADLITLSACETGLGQIVMGEGIIGITRAFMYAGTPSVVVSLWQIADESTAEFMYQFYYNLVNENMNKAEALRKAKVDMIDSRTSSHPFYWAPFVLIGDR